LFHLFSVHESELPLSTSDPDFSGRAYEGQRTVHPKMNSWGTKCSLFRC